MNYFRPAEVRAILFLSFLVFIGSSLTLLKRQGKLSSLNLENLLNSGGYNYSYKVTDLNNTDKELAVEGVIEENPAEKPFPPSSEILDLNSAGYFDLQALPGIGPVLAERIMAYRDSIGAFGSADELLNVTGIGEKKYEQIKGRIVVK